MLHLVYGMNRLPVELWQPLSLLRPIKHGGSSSSLSRTLSTSLTRSVFHSELKTWLFEKWKSFPPLTFSSLSYQTDSTDYLHDHLTFFILLNGWNLFAWCARLSRLLVVFRTHLRALHHIVSYAWTNIRKKLVVRCPSPRNARGRSINRPWNAQPPTGVNTRVSRKPLITARSEA